MNASTLIAFVLLTFIVHSFRIRKSCANLYLSMEFFVWCIFDALVLSLTLSYLGINTRLETHLGMFDSAIMLFFSSFLHAFIANSSFSELVNHFVCDFGSFSPISIVCLIRDVVPISKLFFANMSSYFLHRSLSCFLCFSGM